MLFFVLATVLISIAVFYRWLHGASLTQYDLGYPAPKGGLEPSRESADVQSAVLDFSAGSPGSGAFGAKISWLRDAMDGLADDHELQSEHRVRSGTDAPAGEWFVPEGADPCYRMLYLHGGGFVAGSPKSHRKLTDGLAQTTGLAVFSLDYRLMPEHNRLACVEDALKAWDWLVQNGPDGETPASKLVVAGDSAGGCLALTLLQRLKSDARRQPDAAIAIAPLTDSALHSPSLRFNQDTDILLRGDLGRLLRVPALLRDMAFALMARRSPADPTLSPLRGDLSDLPPTLLHASQHEMLLDDSARYFHKAGAARSPVSFETFANMIHVWHIFWPELPEAVAAMERIAGFLDAQDCLPARPQNDVAEFMLAGDQR